MGLLRGCQRCLLAEYLSPLVMEQVLQDFWQRLEFQLWDVGWNDFRRKSMELETEKLHEERRGGEYLFSRFNTGTPSLKP